MAKKSARWVIAHIDLSNLHYLNTDLRKYPKYRLLEVYIPVINILKKKLKGKNHFESVPLLFNYGFFKVPKYFIPNPHFLDEMRKDLRCLYSWVTDPITLTSKRSIDKPIGLYNPRGIALATEREIKRLRIQEKAQSIYSAKDIDTLFEGKIIILKKYPFENLPATIESIDRDRKKVMVILNLDTPMAARPISVSFENIFYSAYQNYMDTEMKEASIEVIQKKYKNFEGQNDEEPD